jgi:ABC-2 type transport system ATP-binding protein
MSETVVQVDNITKTYGDKTVIAGLTFAIQRGEIFGLLGPNGAGKTTTIEIMEGLRAPDNGTATVLGETTRRLSRETKARIGAQLQESYFEEVLTAREVLERHSAYYPRSHAIEEVSSWVGGLPLDGRIKVFSGGQRKRLAVAVALLTQPEIVFLDEPSAGLDPGSRRRVWHRLKALARSGTTIVLTTNVIEEAEALCDRVGILYDGRLRALDSPRHLVQRFSLTARIDVVNLPSQDIEPLRAIPGVSAVVALPDGMTRIVCQDIRPVLLHLLDSGRTIYEVRQPTLEDAFLIATGDTIKPWEV